MKKRLLSLLFALVLCAGVLLTAALADDKVTVKSITSDPATNGVLSAGSYKLDADITLTTNWTIASGEEVTLDLNGHTLTGTGSGSVITVSGTLTIQDNSTEGGGKIISATSDSATYSYDGGAICINSSGSVTLESGTLSGNTARRGGAVYVGDGATFKMSGTSKITGNSVTKKRVAATAAACLWM